MKIRRFFSGALLCAGCSVTFAGLLAIVLPRFNNAQLRLILASFRLDSTSPFVRLIHQILIFLLDQSWQVFAIGLLAVVSGMILQAGRSTSTTVHASEIQPSHTETMGAPQKENPFAVPSYHQTTPIRSSSVSLHTEPMLERNRVESSADDYAKETTPYFSPRYTAETHAVETTTGSPSQSGHYILIRPAHESTAEDERAYERPQEPIGPVAVTEETSAVPLIKPAPSLRIRSTMGRHDSINGKISSSNS